MQGTNSEINKVLKDINRYSNILNKSINDISKSIPESDPLNKKAKKAASAMKLMLSLGKKGKQEELIKLKKRLEDELR